MLSIRCGRWEPNGAERSGRGGDRDNVKLEIQNLTNSGVLVSGVLVSSVLVGGVLVSAVCWLVKLSS